MDDNDVDLNKLEANTENMKLQKRLLTFMLSKKVKPLPTEDERKPYLYQKANILSKIFFWWIFPVMNTGYKRTLFPEDLYYLTDDLKVEGIYDKFSDIFGKELAKAREKFIHDKAQKAIKGEKVDEEEEFEMPKGVILKALVGTFWWDYMWACIFLILANAGMTLNPLQTKKLIDFVERRALGIQPSVGPGVGYSIGSSAVMFISGILFNHFFYKSMMTGARVRGVLTKALLEKSFYLSSKSNHEYPIGKITSMMGTDSARIDFALGFQPFFFTFPVPIGISIAILVVNIGAPSLVGVGLVFAYILLLVIIVPQMFRLRSEVNVFTDKRVGYIKEVLNNLKMIKFYSWEIPYFNMIKKVRVKESRIIFKMLALRNVLMAVAMSMTLISSMAAFLVLYAIGSGNRTPGRIFSSLSLYSILAQQILMLPMALATGSDAMVGLKRIGKFLASEQVDESQVSIQATGEKLEKMRAEKSAIEIENADFEWEVFEDEDKTSEDKTSEDKTSKDKTSKDKKPSKDKDFSDEKKLSHVSNDDGSSISSVSSKAFVGLREINVSIKEGDFIVITGVIGSGKSSLLSAMSGFMKRTAGDVNVNGSLLLCGYPWIQNATVKENILFGSPYDEKKYNDVIYACALESDLDILPAGDSTEIGERGITLSGGQKARINLARAVYADKEIILMDDVLSAVDARVGKHIMKYCISGLLKNKTRVLATHQLSLVGSANSILFLNGDGTLSQGSYDHLSQTSLAFNRLMQFTAHDSDTDNEEEEVQKEQKLVAQTSRLTVTSDSIAGKNLDSSDVSSEESVRHDFNKNNLKDGRITKSEERAINGIPLEIYKQYIIYGFGKLWVLWSAVAIFLISVSAYCMVFTNTWLSFWTENKFKNRDNGFYIGIYVMFVVLSLIFLFFMFVCLSFQSNAASRKLNILAIKNVLYTPMSFIDTTPMGRIINRFTKDTDSLDNEIGDQVRMLFYFLSQIVAVIILCICYLPWFAIAVPVLGFFYVAIANYYQSSAREIKRLEAVQRSFVYNNFNEVLNGMDTIKSYNSLDRFLRKNDKLINRMNEAYYLSIANQRWLGIHLDFVATGLIIIISFLCIFRVFNIGAASVGLLVSYTMQITGQLSMVLRTLTQVENEMNSVERLYSYANHLPQEAPYNIEATAPPIEWPQHGVIKFNNVSLRYREELPLVLKNISFNVKPGEKIGICGRTGAGKSSIMTALYRLSELDEGRIEIDDIDISVLGLNELRSKLSIIPQDPVLFRGTVRSNLDPFGEKDDELLWKSLVRSGIIDSTEIEAVKKETKGSSDMNKFHLDQTVEEEGSNFSLGEKQLIAFARALVRETKILILDEATSSVDYETDSKIQGSVIKQFGDCTILCIAHRLRTILNYDKILVLDKGELSEFDTPYNLFKTKGGIFSQMCERSGIVEQDFALKV